MFPVVMLLGWVEKLLPVLETVESLLLMADRERMLLALSKPLLRAYLSLLNLVLLWYSSSK